MKTPYKQYHQNVGGYWFDLNGNCIRLTTYSHGSELYLKHSLFGISREDLKIYGDYKTRLKGIKNSDMDELEVLAFNNGWCRMRFYPESKGKVIISITSMQTKTKIKHLLKKFNIVKLIMENGFKTIRQINLNDGSHGAIFNEVGQLTIDDVL